MQNRALFFRIFFLFFFSFNTLHANALTQYREYGIQNIAKEMDLDLANREYWDNYLANINTLFGYMESYNNILLCDKSKSILSLYTKNKLDEYTLIQTYNAYTGKERGNKHQEGDFKTPDGVYTLTQKLSKVDSFYGPMAFVTSYPNTYDKYLGNDGHGIWIHGLPTDQKRDNFTKGCIAIKNQSLECLDRDIDISKTVLIIHEEGEKKDVSKDTLATILAQIYAWRYAWLYNDLESYLSFYDSSFMRFDGMNKKNFSHYKKRIFAKNESKKILFNNINVIPYPGRKNIFSITFSEKYRSDSFSFSGEKTLIIKLENESMHIITEK